MPKLSQKMKEMVTENMRRTILMTSEEIIITFGLESLTMERLANEAEISTGSIYNYFHNKEEIVQAIMENSFQRLLTTLEDVSQKECRVDLKLWQIADCMFGDFHRVRGLHDAIFRRQPPVVTEKFKEGHRRLIELLAGVLRQGMEEGILEERDAALTASMFLGMIRELQFDMGAMFGRYNPAELAESVTSLFLSGLKAGGHK